MFQVKIETKGELRKRDIEDESASEAIETMYSGEDKVIFKWDDIDFIAYLEFDIGDCWRDIIKLKEDLQSDQKEFDIQFPSQTFWHYWTFKEKEESKWRIEAFWGYESRKCIEVDKKIFQSEFQKIINRVEFDLKKQGYDLFELIEYQCVRKNDHDRILAWRKYPEPLGSNYYYHSLQKEFYVEVLFDFCQIQKAAIFAEGWDFLLSNYGLKKLYEIDKKSGWFDTDSAEEWLESILYQGLISGINLQSKNYGIYKEESDIFETIDKKIETINWEKFKSQHLI